MDPGEYRCRSGHWDGCIDPERGLRPLYARLAAWLARGERGGIDTLQRTAELSLLNQGITFTVYADGAGTERIFPFDVLPRLIDAPDWAALEAGIVQRLRALNLFLSDLYGAQRILRDGVVPTELVVTSPHFRREMVGLEVPEGIWMHVSGIDLIQDETGRFRVLEDNLRVPSGVSYVLENRAVMARIAPELLQEYAVQRVDHYPRLLLEALTSSAANPEPTVAVLTPGAYNSAYYEHSFLASQMGVELCEGRDLVVDDDVLYMKTSDGLRRIDVLYRRVDDAFLDPLAFRADSLLGVPGLMHAYRAGHLTLANAPGTGVVDDKAMYAYVPRVIRYYLDEDPILEQVPTYLCREPKDLSYVVDHLQELVLKPVDGAGGYGLVMGPQASRDELSEARAALRDAPHRFIAQPVQKLSTLPTYVPGDERDVQPRHVDLRPFAVYGANDQVTVLPGGLTRVALREGNLVVNSSQGGGSKDTWVLHEDRSAAHA